MSPKEGVILPKDGREDFKRTVLQLNHDNCVRIQQGGKWSGVSGRTFKTEGTARANTRCVQRVTRSLVQLQCEAVQTACDGP